MARILSGSIDLSKIDRTKITEKDGKKYYPIQVIINDSNDQYGNIASVVQNQTKEERDAKTTKIYLGNLKQTWANEGQATVKPAANPNVSNNDIF